MNYSQMVAAGLLNVVSRAKVAMSTLKPKRTMVQLQGQADDVQQTVELLIHYGFSALPAPGADMLLLRVAGRAEGGVAIMADDPALRIADLQATEFGYNDARGQRIVFRGDHLEITSTMPVVVNSPTITLGGTVGAGKKVALDGDPVVDGMVQASSTTTMAV